LSPFPDTGEDIFRDFPENYDATYLFRFPFGLGLDADRDSVIQTINLEALAQDQSVAESQTHVSFKFLRLPTGGERYFSENLNGAAHHFYGQDLPISDPDLRFAPKRAYELWVSAETPLRRFPGEPQTPSRTLERCFRAIDVLLRAYRLATRDPSVFPLGPAGMSKSVPVGVRNTKGQWQFLMMLIMRPESGIQLYPTDMTAPQLAAFTSAVQALTMNQPFIRGKDLELTAYRQAYALDDLTAAIVSLQTSMESTLFELWHVSMVDMGMSRPEIEAQTQSDRPFKTLFTTTMPSILGGNWDVTDSRRVPGDYWQKLYLLRNEVVHSGSRAQEWQFDAAWEAHKALIRHVAQRLLLKWREYPRTLAAFGSARGLPQGLSPSKAAQIRMNTLFSEAKPFWLPPDGI
jgi:hypothetical protein